MLKWLAIGFGVFIIVTRGLGILFPAKMKNVWTSFASNQTALRVTGVVMLILALLLLIAVGRDTAGVRGVMWLLAIACFAGGLLLAVLPKQYGVMVAWLMKLSDHTIRVLSGIGLIIGILILILGVAYY
ncbi:MAG: hypothetical protein Kow0099_27950 [Candidatus Abyssubacteria bacterium]